MPTLTTLHSKLRLRSHAISGVAVDLANPNHVPAGSSEGGRFASSSAAAIADYAKNGIHAKAFKTWFGDWQNDPAHASKVVGSDGAPQQQHPLKLYHGTVGKGFDVFEKGKEKPGSNGDGFYFTDDPELARKYAGDTGRVLPVYLNIKNPYVLGATYDPTNTVKLDAACKALGLPVVSERINADIAFAQRTGIRYTNQNAWTELANTVGLSKANIVLQKAGYDGISTPWEGYGVYVSDKASVWVAFEPEQIKAVKNQGTFDPHNPSIYLSNPNHDDHGRFASVAHVASAQYITTYKHWQQTVTNDRQAVTALVGWTGTAYQYIRNYEAMGTGTPEVKQTDKTLNKVLDGGPEYTGVVWRGISHVAADKAEQYAKVGNVVTLNALSSFSKSRILSVAFATNSDTATTPGILFRVTGPTGSVDITPFNTHERETVAPKGTTYKVVGSKYDNQNKIWNVHLERVTRKVGNTIALSHTNGSLIGHNRFVDDDDTFMVISEPDTYLSNPNHDDKGRFSSSGEGGNHDVISTLVSPQHVTDSAYTNALGVWQNNITPEQHEAFQVWAADSHALRDAEKGDLHGIGVPTSGAYVSPEHVKDIVRNMRSAIATAPEYSGEVWRGVRGFDGQTLSAYTTPGNVVNMAASASFSTSDRQADEFADHLGHGAILHVHGDTGGADIAALSGFDESEIMVPKGTHYKILAASFTKDNSMWHIDMQKVN